MPTEREIEAAAIAIENHIQNHEQQGYSSYSLAVVALEAAERVRHAYPPASDAGKIASALSLLSSCVKVGPWSDRCEQYKNDAFSAVRRLAEAAERVRGDGWMPIATAPKDCEAVTFKLGDGVVKSGGDYHFYGDVVAVFRKRSGAVRVVVENQDGVLHIFNPSQLRPCGDP